MIKLVYDDLYSIRKKLIDEYTDSVSTVKECEIYNMALVHFMDELIKRGDDNEQLISAFALEKYKMLSHYQNLINIDEINAENKKLKEDNAELKEKVCSLQEKISEYERGEGVTKSELSYRNLKMMHKHLMDKQRDLKNNYDQLLSRYCTMCQKGTAGNNVQ